MSGAWAGCASDTEPRVELPDEIQQAQWIKEERQKILEEARKEYEKIVADAKDQAAAMIDTNEITVQSKVRADEITRIAEANVKGLKVNGKRVYGVYFKVAK